MNILLIKFAAIGDVLMATPAFRAIRKRYPAARITLMIGEWSAPIVKTNPHIDQIVAFPDRDFFGMNPIGVYRAWQRLKVTSWDTVIVMQRALPWILLARMLPAKQRVGFDQGLNRVFLDITVKEDTGTHHTYRYLELAKAIGATPQGTEMDFGIGEKEQEFSESIWKETGLNAFHPVVAISPGGAENPKEKRIIRRYPLNHYREVVSRLLENSQTAIIVAGGQSDTELAHALCNEFTQRVVNLCEKTTLSQLGAILKKCDLLITHDSGPLHIGAAVGTPTLALFGLTLPNEKAPLGQKHRFIQSTLAKGTIDAGGYLKERHDQNLMEAISVEEVVRETRKMLRVSTRENLE